MATVGNLFVNVGANTRALESGLKRGEKQVQSFASKATSSLSGLRLQIPGFGAMGVDLGVISERIKSITGSFSGFAAITKAAAEQQGKLTAAIKASEAASQALAGAKGARKNIGEARAMLGKAGIDPNKAATALKTVDTSGLREKITTSTKAAADARLALTAAEKAGAASGAEQAAAALSKAQNAVAASAARLKESQNALSAATKSASGLNGGYYATLMKDGQATRMAASANKQLEKSRRDVAAATAAHGQAEQALKAVQNSAPVLAGASAIEAAKKRLVDATMAQKKAEEALGAARAANQAKEAMRAKLGAKGIDLSKGQGALKLQDLSPFQKAAAAAKAEVVSLESSLAKSGKGMGNFAKYAMAAVNPVLAVGAALGAALAAAMAFTMGQAKQMDALQDAAIAAGMNVEAMQKMSATYNELGAAAGSTEMASQKLAMKLQEAVQGSTEAQESFRGLGLDLESIASSTPDEALQKTIGAISALGSQREKMLALKDVFGKSGVGLAAVVNASAEAFKEASDRASKIVIPASIVSTLAATNDKVESTFKAFDKLQAVLAAKIAPTLDKMADALFNFMTTDTASLESGFEGIAAVVSVIYEVCVAIVDVIRIVWNAACFLIEGAMAIIAGICGGILKLVQAIAYGFEVVSGSTHEASESIGEAADLALELTKQLAIAAGMDLSDVGSAMGMSTEDAAKSVEKAAAAAQQAAAKHAVTIRIEADRASMKKVQDELQSMRDKVAVLRFGEDEVQLDRIGKGSKQDVKKMDEAVALQQTLKILEASADVKQQIAETAQRIRATYNDSASITAKQLALEKGVKPELAEQLATLIEREELQQRIHAATKAGNDIVKDLQSQVDGVGMSEMETLRLKMDQQGIGDDLIKQALELQGILDSAKIDSSLKDHFASLNESLLKATGNERALIENQLKNIGLTGDALQNAVDKTMDINAKIDEANKQTTNTETITSTIQDLADQLDALKLGDAGVLEKKLRSAGAGDTEVAKALAMQAEIAAINDAKTAGADKGQKDIQGVVDSIDTAFGSFKLGGASSGEMVQKDILSESAKQTQLLSVIAGKTTGTVMMAGMADQSGASLGSMPGTVGMTKTDTDLVSAVNQSNKYLADIASNTAAFAGVLT